mgnify:CR=1 FL=1
MFSNLSDYRVYFKSGIGTKVGYWIGWLMPITKEVKKEKRWKLYFKTFDSDFAAC